MPKLNETLKPKVSFLLLWPVLWIDVLLIQPLSQVSCVDVCDGVVTSLIWPILIQLNTNILTLFPRTYSFCCSNLESVAVPVVWATFMTSFQKDSISPVNIRLKTCPVTKRGMGAHCPVIFECSFLSLFLAPWDLYSLCPVTLKGQGCEFSVPLTSPGLAQSSEPWAPAQRIRMHIYRDIKATNIYL